VQKQRDKLAARFEIVNNKANLLAEMKQENTATINALKAAGR
jgi:hypothetical protein